MAQQERSETPALKRPGEAVQMSQEGLRKTEFVLLAYLAHLLVPLFLILDITTAWRLRYIHFELLSGSMIVLTVSVLWLAIGLGAFLTPDRKAFLRRISRPLLAIYAVYLSLILLELFLRVAISSMLPIPTAFPPGKRWVHEIDSSICPGVHGVKNFTVNESGLRGPPLLGMKDAYKIVTIGGSTTECLALDDSEEWAHLLMQEINARQKGHRVWIGNAGRDGHNTVHHLAFLKTLPILKQVDMLIFLIGANDLEATLAFEGAATQHYLETMADANPQYPLCKHLRLFRFVVALAPSPKSGLWLDMIPAFRKRRAEGTVVPLPDLQIGLEEYRARVLALAGECRALGVRCLFLTQPTILRGDLTPAEQQLLWDASVGRWEKPNGYVSAADAARAMNAYSHTLLEECRRSGLECYDLASSVPRDTSAFFDQFHFTEGGARIVAHELAAYLLSRPPFQEEGRSASETKH